ncbi:MAG: hypothetical protein K9L17_01065 [Clostridiales bacterium]|nr:hypothetical protein [Clostridiales bacterium]MCF8021283.1 hypothetical protein [Clostridiales bacterium]
MNTVTAVLLDTVSIQKYVFASNLLKENLGASYLVDNIYNGDLKESLKEVLGFDPDVDSWQKDPQKINIAEDSSVEYETGYIGGGNALLLFRELETAKVFVNNWTRRLLVTAPGLQIAAAIGNLDLDNNSFSESLVQLFKQLTKNKNKFFPNTSLPKHGITADCPHSGFSTEFYYEDFEYEKVYVSSVSWSKLCAAQKSEEKIIKEYKEVLGNNYTFTNKIDLLGQVEGKSYISIVHIDGNEMGKRFSKCQTLPERRNLSIAVDKATKSAFGKLLQYIRDNIGLLQEEGFNINKNLGKTKTIFPIRPIVLGGDDVTFVTDGRLGVHLAEKFVRFIEKEKIGENENLYTSAGVVITKSKHPFFRGYEMAEGLCDSAKEGARKQKNSSWLDFHIVYGGFSGNLGEIREKNIAQGGKLYFGPYIISNLQETKSITNLKNGIKEFGDKEKWPRSKVKELRSVLPLGKSEVEKFIRELRGVRLRLPYITGEKDYSINGWEDKETPYFDMIELLEFYPISLLSEQGV